MATDDALVICANLDCRVAEDGKCVEGFEIDACPHYGRTPEADEDRGAESEPSLAEGVVLPAADTLTPSDVGHVLRAGDARIIAIIGPTDAGKTSLIASLYDLFQEAPIDGVEFARSLACTPSNAPAMTHGPRRDATPRI